MRSYNHILAAVDLTDEAEIIIEKAKKIAQENNAKLTLVHAVEPLSIAYGSDIPLDLISLQEEITNQAMQRVEELQKKLVSSTFDCCHHIVYGRTDKEVHRIAQDTKVDLIVVGSHGKHGLGLLFGSTSSSILHDSPCDVLAVRIHKEK